ncbi:hybrid sensor histidine kinase/response regulator transcription factor [Carboxylicivirga marina]|uniref:histidine kinase n=1 Tax=Carboxylicivirga marina TaxID=2800988 RepID=A0ABS1HEY5_9BACT|nr:hybrid sensor histidine kinase/response regulator transcription factor [Carboxylicivirga marina]MBK3516185.1 response regulator [Carboxylicivirga marina]
MNFKRLIHIFSITCLFLSGNLANGQEYLISYLSVEDGLSQNEVTSIVQDKYGYMWFGTRGGLNRYDGYQFKHYKPESEEGLSVQDASVECLYQDSKGQIWVGTQTGGVSYYDSEKERFIVPAGSERFEKSRVISFDEDAKGQIYIGSFGNRLYKYLGDSCKMHEIYAAEISHSVKIINDTLLFWGDQSGLTKLGDEKQAETIKFIEDYQEPLDIMVDKQEPYLWIVGWRLNLIRYNYINGKSKSFAIPGFSINHDGGSALLQDNEGNIWVGTRGKGLYLYNVDNSEFKRINIKPNTIDATNRDYDVILDIYQDEANNIWVGTDGGGIVRLSKKKQFDTFEQSTPIGGQHITSVLEDRDGILWIGTKGNGLYKRDNNGKFVKVVHSDSTNEYSFESEYVRSIYESDDGLILIGFETSLFVVNKNEKGRDELVHADRYLRSPSLYLRKPIDMLMLDNQFWVATDQAGLQLFEKKNGVFVHKESFNDYDKKGQLGSTLGLTLHLDDKLRFWIGTKAGLFLKAKGEETFINVNSLVSSQEQPGDQAILCIHTDRDGDIWFGTPNSLNQLIELSEGNYQLIQFTKEDGLPDDYINCILSSYNGDIWISTNAGLSKFNKKTKRFSNYNDSDGIRGLNFSVSAGCVGQDGHLYFGAYNGLTYFNASKIKENNYLPPIVIAEFKILNKDVPVNGDVLKANINEQRSIKLNHQQNEFSFEFAALDYKATELNQYAYWLEGRDDTRVMLGKQRFVSFSNLKPGSYTLHLYGTNSNGIWSDNECVIDISVSIAPWKSGLAIVVYVLLIVSVVVVIVRVGRKQEKLNRDVEMEKMLREQQKQLNEEKLSFFTNVSHELRTPLTLILAPVSELLSNDFSKYSLDYIKSKVEVVHQNTTSLLSLVGQLLEFRKIEAKKIKLQASENNVVEFTKQICQPFENYAKNKSTHFKMDYSEASDALIYFDNEKMAVILNNLLSNAFKFSGEPGKVKIAVNTDLENKVLISVSNNGKGINEKDLEFLYDRFYKGSDLSFSASSGIGLSLVKNYIELHKGEIQVDSKPGEQTTFTLSLLKGKQHLHDDEMTQSPTKIQLFEGNPKKVSNILQKPKKAIEGSTILIVEDNSEIRSYMQQLLESIYNVITANDGLEAFDKVIEHKPDLVISDVMMPRMDGFELCKKIKTNALVSHIPVILLTAKGTKKDEVFGTRQGADAYITKPFDVTLLQEKINMLIESRLALSNKYADKVILAPNKKEIETEDARFLKKAVQIIETNIHDVEFNPEKLAELMAMSNATIYRRCKKVINKTPGAFIRSIRLKRAAQLLIDSDLAVAEIVEEVAYQDVSGFRRGFVKEYNMSPSDYRKAHRSGSDINTEYE